MTPALLESKTPAGSVSVNRRPQLIRTIIAAHGWPTVLAA